MTPKQAKRELRKMRRGISLGKITWDEVSQTWTYCGYILAKGEDYGEFKKEFSQRLSFL